VADKWLKTPLHYASQRGASICAMYLVQRGGQLEAKDIYGNTALGVGLMHSHYNYGIILIQKGASVHPLSFREDPERIKKQWEAEAAKKKAVEDEDMKDEGFAQHRHKKHQDLFVKKAVFNDYDEEDESEGSDEDSDEDEVHQETVFNQQNAFGMQVFAQPARKPYGGYNQFN
jgi:hypothetical protein